MFEFDFCVQISELSCMSPAWQLFLDKVDEIVLSGLKSSVLESLKLLNESCSAENETNVTKKLYYFS